MQEDYAEFQKAVEDIRLRVAKQVDALVYQAEKKIAEGRSEYQKKYWQRTKIQQHLIEGGFTTALAKHLCETIMKYDDVDAEPTVPVFSNEEHPHLTIEPALATFLCTSPAVWQREGEGAKVIAPLFEEKTVKTTLNTIYQALVESLKNSPAWHGSVGDVACTFDWSKIFTSGELGPALHTDMNGSMPWMMGSRKNVRRRGPEQVPSPGLPLLLCPQNQAVFVHCIHVMHLLEAGIPVQSYDAFVGTQEGIKVVKEQSTTVLLRPSDIMYVPPGHLVYVTFYMATGKKKVEDLHFAGTLLIPLTFEKVLASLSDGVKSSMMAWHTQATADRRLTMWADRKSFLQAVFAPAAA